MDDEDDDSDEPDENDEELFQNDSAYSTLKDIQTEGPAESKEMKKFSVYINDDIDGELYSYCQISIQVMRF